MNQKTKINKRWDLYLELLEYLKNYMNLWVWNIGFEWKDFSNKWNAIATIENCEYDYYNASIIFDNKNLLYKDKIDFDFSEIATTLIHELSHIFVSTWSFYLSDEVNKKNLSNFYWWHYHQNLINIFVSQEERMNNLLDKVLFKWISKEKEYIEFEKRFNLLNK